MSSQEQSVPEPVEDLYDLLNDPELDDEQRDDIYDYLLVNDL